jgi:hypothetical protein
VKNPSDLTGKQLTTLAGIAVTIKALYQAYLLKEQLRAALAVKGPRDADCSPAGWPGPAGSGCPRSSTRQHRRAVPAADPGHPRSEAVQRPLGGNQRPPAPPDPPACGFHSPTHSSPCSPEAAPDGHSLASHLTHGHGKRPSIGTVGDSRHFGLAGPGRSLGISPLLETPMPGARNFAAARRG